MGGQRQETERPGGRRWRGQLGGVLMAVLTITATALTRANAEWAGALSTALQQRDADSFWRLLGWFPLLGGAIIVAAVVLFYVVQMLQLRWRRWLTQHYLQRWLGQQAFYRLELARNAPGGQVPDNPDQRIQEDVNVFTEMTLVLASGLLRSLLTLCLFTGMLWGVSEGADITLPQALGGAALDIPGFMVWMAVLYCLVGSAITFWIGKPQVWLNSRQQQLEANFRHHLIRVREHAEAIALDGGERVEGAQIGLRFGDALGNYLNLIKKQKSLGWFTNFFGQAAVVFPFIIAAPRFFSGAIQLGQLMQIGSAFNQVQDSLSWIVNNYSDIAAWRATTLRLAGFDESLREQEEHPVGVQLAASTQLQTRALDVSLPAGSPIVADAELQIRPGQRLLISGASGSGKSTLLRAFAGIWPYARGQVERPLDAMFIPQRPYFPDGSLRDALAYPEPAASYSDAELKQVLREAQLPQLQERLDSQAAWNSSLSGGEQQRLSVARVLLKRPAWVFADEATSALDNAAEAQIYSRLVQLVQSRGGALVSVAHRDSVTEFHTARWLLSPQQGIREAGPAGSC